MTCRDLLNFNKVVDKMQQKKNAFRYLFGLFNISPRSQVFGFIPDNSTNRAVATFIQSLAPLNSAANPLIYCLFSTNIGQTLCNLLGCRKKPPNMSTGMTTSTHSSSSNKPSASNGRKNDASLRPLLSNSMSVSIGSSDNGMRKLSGQRSLAGSD